MLGGEPGAVARKWGATASPEHTLSGQSHWSSAGCSPASTGTRIDAKGRIAVPARCARLDGGAFVSR